MTDPLQNVRTEPGGPWSGILHAFVAFDWGEEVNLEQARRKLPAELHVLPRRSRTPQYIAYQSPPLRFELPPLNLTLPVVGSVQSQTELMLFDFGTVSLATQVPFRLRAPDLTRLAGELADPALWVQAARDALEPFFQSLRETITNPDWADLSEEYFVFQLIPETTTSPPLQLLAQHAGWLAGLVRLEAGPLSDSEIAEALRLRLSYSPEDLIITDWTAAVVVDRECAEVLETMAFANLQLLEFRHIEKRLDSRLKTAYGLIRQLARTRLPIWRMHARPLRDLGELKAEVNEMFERASDALTLVGDPYVARLYHQLAIRFHLEQWGQNIRRSISVLESIYQSVSDQAATYRTEALEIVVVILILVEVVQSFIRH
jgi:hypothetical protein